MRNNSPVGSLSDLFDVSSPASNTAHSTRLDAHPDHVQHILGKNGLLRYLAASQLDAHQVWSSIEDAVGLAILSVATYVVPSAKGAGGERAK